METTVLANLTVRPAESLGIRLLVVPRCTDFYGNTELQQVQWWIEFTVRP